MRERIHVGVGFEMGWMLVVDGAVVHGGEIQPCYSLLWPDYRI